MEKLIRRYNEECDIIKRCGSKIWKIGLIGLFLLSLVVYVWLKNYLLSFFILTFFTVILYFICELINVKCICSKLEIVFDKDDKRKIIKYIKNTYIELDRFQKKWITNYCKINKINKIEKIHLLRECLKQKTEEKNKKYISPIIMATLLLTIWENVIEYLDDHFGIFNTIIIAIIAAVIIALIIEFIRNEFVDQREFFNMFDKISGYKRLDELLIYVAIKCNK